MNNLPRRPMALHAAAVAALLCSSPLLAQNSVKRVEVLGTKDAVEIEVETSERVTPQTRVLSGPDRLVVDFPNAVPGKDLRSQSVYRGQVKDLRVGLFRSNPPVTRIVLDLTSAQSYQIFPGQKVMIKVMGGENSGPAFGAYAEPAARPGLVTANYVTGAQRVSVEPAIPAPKPLDVSFRDGMLAIHASKATLSEVLYAVQQKTGAEIGIASGAEQESVVVDLGPAPAADVLAHLLNGSRFNFLIVNNVNDPQKLDRLILTPRVDGGGSAATMPLQPMVQNDEADDEVPPPPPPPQPNPAQAQAQQGAPVQNAPQQPPDANSEEQPQ